MAVSMYEGPVCYGEDGWHYTVVPHPDGAGNGDEGHVYEVPGERLVCEDNEDGSESRYRLATDEDTASWHDRKHGKFVTCSLDDGSAAVTVTPEELEAVKTFLDERREGGQ